MAGQETLHSGDGEGRAGKDAGPARRKTPEDLGGMGVFMKQRLSEGEMLDST